MRSQESKAPKAKPLRLTRRNYRSGQTSSNQGGGDDGIIEDSEVASKGVTLGAYGDGKDDARTSGVMCDEMAQTHPCGDNKDDVGTSEVMCDAMAQTQACGESKDVARTSGAMCDGTAESQKNRLFDDIENDHVSHEEALAKLSKMDDDDDADDDKKDGRSEKTGATFDLHMDVSGDDEESMEIESGEKKLCDVSENDFEKCTSEEDNEEGDNGSDDDMMKEFLESDSCDGVSDALLSQMNLDKNHLLQERNISGNGCGYGTKQMINIGENKGESSARGEKEKTSVPAGGSSGMKGSGGKSSERRKIVISQKAPVKGTTVGAGKQTVPQRDSVATQKRTAADDDAEHEEQRKKPKFSCIVCSKGHDKERAVVFTALDYNFKYEIIQKVFQEFVEDKKKIHYLCRVCHDGLKHEEGKEPWVPVPVSKRTKEQSVYLCTCCHMETSSKALVKQFMVHKYDFTNKIVQMCLHKDIRKKNGLAEFICNSCHEDLRRKKCGVVKMPSGAVGAKQKQTFGHHKWSEILETMKKKKTFEELSQYVEQLALPDITDIHGNKHLIGYKRDALAWSLIPDDSPIEKESAFPVYTKGDGNCFVYSLSQLIYGDALHGNEMRCRVVCEGVRNRDLYLSHDYLIRGYTFPYPEERSLPTIYCTYSAEYEEGMVLSDENIRKCYESELMTVRLDHQECGIWQFHQAANALGMPLFSMYPEIVLPNLRADFNRIFLPATEGVLMQNPLVIMWTKCNAKSYAFRHFVPVVQWDKSIRFTDLNRTGHVAVPIMEEAFVDLTHEPSSDAEVFPSKQSDKKKKEWIKGTESKKKEEMEEKMVCCCTCCHRSFADGKFVRPFSVSEYDFENILVQHVLESSKRCKSDNGVEYICHTCRNNLKEKQGMKKSVCRCTCCHRSFEGDKIFIKPFNVSEYDFGNKVVERALDTSIRCQSDNGVEYICKTCRNNLRRQKRKQPTMPRNCVASQRQRNQLREEKIYKCTCCHHMYSKQGKYLLYFDEMRYNFDNSVVQEALACDVRCRSVNDMEYICRNCDNQLREEEPVMPRKAIANRKRQHSDENQAWRDKVQKAGEEFVRCSKELPEYVCTSCHRALFKESVKAFREEHYDSEDYLVRETLLPEYRYKGEGKCEYICGTCHKSLLACKMPSQAVANQLTLPEIPAELENLNRLEVRCISLRIPFMQIRAMPKGGQGKITGPCVNVPASMEPITEILPRIPEGAHIILLKLKRRLVYKSHYLSDCIHPERVMCALEWLVSNNPHYAHVTIDRNWLDRIHDNPMFVEESKSASDERQEEEMELSSEEDDSGMLQEDQEEVNRRAEVTVEPTTSCIQIDNLEQTAFSIAPGEGAIPKYILLDKDFEVLAFPNLFPGGFGGYDVLQPRKRKLELKRYINQRLFNVDSRCATDPDFIFAFQYATELQQLKGDMNMAIRKVTNSGSITAGNLRNREFVTRLYYDDLCYKWMKNIRGTPAYWQSNLYDILAMVRRFGCPTWFLTLSPAEFRWPEFVQACAAAKGKQLSIEDVNAMKWGKKAEILSSNPVRTCEMFMKRLNSFFRDFLLSDAAPLGKITDHCAKIEFQVRGSPHCHALLWVEDAPRIDEATDEEVCKFVDTYVNGKIPPNTPQEADTRDLVTTVQTHRHSSNCRPHPNAECQYDYPRDPSSKTVISRQLSKAEEVETEQGENRKIRKEVKHAMAENHEWNLDEILHSVNVSEDRYLECLKVCSKKGTRVILERDTRDVYTNNCNLDCLRFWRANMDLQYVADAYACIQYILSYVLKPERGMSELLRQAALESSSQGYREQMKKVASTFANKREVSIQEAVMRVTSQWMFRKSRTRVFIHNGPKETRCRVPLPKHILDTLNDDDENVFCTNIHERYAARPDCMESECLASFGTWWVPVGPSEKVNWRTVIKLKDGMGKMRKRTREALMRTHGYAKHSSLYYHSKLLLFMPWRKEEDDLLNGYSSYEEHYSHVREEVERNAKVHKMATVDIDGALEEYFNNVADVSHLMESHLDNESLKEDCFTDKKEERDWNSPLSLRYAAEAMKGHISNEEYRRMMRQLNDEQKAIVLFNRAWVKKCIWKMKEGVTPEGYRVFVSGPGGTGKSFVIAMIYRDIIVLYRKSNTLQSPGLSLRNMEEILIGLLAAYTGTASFNINGATLHGTFHLQDGNKLSTKKQTTMKTRMDTLQHLTIDEVSMVGAHHLALINDRCAMVKDKDAGERNFGNINVLLVGDLYQLPPVRASLVFEKVKNDKNLAYLSTPIWEEFVMHELTQVMRQRDRAFAAMLNQVRVGKPGENTEVDLALKERELSIGEDHPDYPRMALHVYAQNVYATERNEKILDSIDSQLYVCKAQDSIKDQRLSLASIIMPTRASDTGNLRKTVLVKVGARVMLTNNVDVSDGLTNGAYGEVVHIVRKKKKDSDGNVFITDEVHAILVRFDSSRVGIQARGKSPYKGEYPEAVPIYRIEVSFMVYGSKTVEVSRRNFPLTLAWAVTIHKVQGMTVDRIVVDMTESKGNYTYGQAYVAFSRVKTYEQLYIINYSRHQIRTCPKVHAEMERLRERKLPALDDPLVRTIGESYLRIGHINMQGLGTGEYCKREDLKCDEDINQLDVVCLTETHLGDGCALAADEIWKLKEGSVHNYNRKRARGGGVAIAVSAKYKSQRVRLELHRDHLVEVVAVEISCAKKIIVAAIYIPPGQSNSGCVEYLQYVLHTFSTLKYDRVVLVGDFNENLLRWAGKHDVRDFLVNEGFEQHISVPTTDYASLLDHVYTRGIQDVKVDVQDAYYSDHDKTFCFVR